MTTTVWLAPRLLVRTPRSCCTRSLSQSCGRSNIGEAHARYTKLPYLILGVLQPHGRGRGQDDLLRAGGLRATQFNVSKNLQRDSSISLQSYRALAYTSKDWSIIRCSMAQSQIATAVRQLRRSVPAFGGRCPAYCQTACHEPCC